MKQKRILVTGGTGFIGTHLVNTLLHRYPGVEIEVVDNLSNSTFPPQRAAFFAEHGVAFFHTSVEEFKPGIERYDQIYHLACPVGPAGVLKYAGRMAKMIVVDSLAMAAREIAAKSSTPRRITMIGAGSRPGPLGPHSGFLQPIRNPFRLHQ